MNQSKDLSNHPLAKSVGGLNIAAQQENYFTGVLLQCLARIQSCNLKKCVLSCTIADEKFLKHYSFSILISQNHCDSKSKNKSTKRIIWLKIWDHGF